MAYQVILQPSAERQLSKLPRDAQRRVVAKLAALAENPRAHGVEKLAGEDDFYRVRVGNYRIVFSIDDARVIVYVLRIADRKDVYRR
jgi:mRNA interferase RelE/StbE